MFDPISFIVQFDAGRTAPNRLVGLCWQARGRELKAAKSAGRWAWMFAGQPRVDCPVTVDVVIRRARALDADNAVASIKGCLDGIFNDGLTEDDSPRWLSIGTVTQETAREHKGRESVEFIVSPRKEQLDDPG